MMLSRARVVLCSMLLGASLASAGAAVALDFKSGERVEAGGRFADALFAAGREVDINLTSSDDVFAAGRDIRVRQVSGDHLLMAAATATFEAGEARDVILFAGDARFTGGKITDDLVATAGVLRLDRTFSVGGSALISGGRIEVESPVGGALVVKGDTVRIDAPVRGSVDVTAEHLVVGPNARITGSLSYSAQIVDISPSATVTGQEIARPREGPDASKGVIADVIGAVTLAALIFVVGGALLVLVAVSAFPNLMDRAAARIDNRPIDAMGVGALLLLFGPAIIVLLLVSLVGLPLGLLVAAIYLAAAPLALATTVYWAGMKARRTAARGRALQPADGWARLGWSVLAIGAMCLIGAIPVVGGAVWLVVFVIGLGALTVEARKSLAQA